MSPNEPRSRVAALRPLQGSNLGPSVPETDALSPLRQGGESVLHESGVLDGPAA